MIAATRWLTLLGYFGLLGLLSADHTLFATPGRPVALLLLLQVGPLLFPLRGLLHGRPYTHAWTSFLALYYFVLAVDGIAAGRQPAALPWLELGLSMLLFGACVLYARLEGRRQRLAHTSAEPLP
ncbi:MAG TPA: DUF2069 domain-containing protein [Candidatus Competibacteraceae bacterium]|nr:DUF2069 domain-containing protein [Candidatus Competibacteraceae bacterium]